MNEKRYVYRLPIVNVFQIGQTESWLSHMAQQGYHLDRSNIFFIRFQKGEPQDVKYRIDLQIKLGEEQKEEMRKASEGCGWEFAGYMTAAGAYRECAVFRSPTAAGAPELHTDPAEQAYTVKGLRYKLMAYALFVAVIAFILFQSLWEKWPDQVGVFSGEHPLMLLVAALYTYILATAVWEAAAIWKLWLSLKEGRPIDHHAGWKRARRLDQLCSMLRIIFFAAAVLLIF